MSSIESLAEVITEEDISNEHFENRELDSQTLDENIEETTFEEKESNESISTTRAEEVLFENDPSNELNLPNILPEDRFNDESNEHESTTSRLEEDFTSEEKEKSPDIYLEMNLPEDQDSSYQAFSKAKSMWEDFNHSESPKNVDSPISSQLNHQSPTTSSIMKNIFPLKSYSSSYRKSDPSYFENEYETPVIFQRLYESASIAKVKREKLTEYYVRQEAEEIEKSKY
jgi:hypothetical protein